MRKAFFSSGMADSSQESSRAMGDVARSHVNGRTAKEVPVDLDDAQVQQTGRFPAWKRALDIACVLCAMPLWLPVMVLIGAGIKITSPGPAFFRQERVGYHGRRFTLLKFRSMQPDVQTSDHEGYLNTLIREDRPMTKLDAKGDPRIIPLGRLLRASGLDELPQLFNVLMGDMSLVGPRPCTAYEREQYTQAQLERFNAPPGLTGYWQVNGKNRTTFSEMIAMDILYARRMSPMLDLVIMVKTLPAIWRQVNDVFARKTQQTQARGSNYGA